MAVEFNCKASPLKSCRQISRRSSPERVLLRARRLSPHSRYLSKHLWMPLFEMCCFHMGIAPIALKGEGVKACQDGLGYFFPTLPRGARACQDGLGQGGGSKAIWAMPI